jgi:hypothetical protein
MYKPQNLHPKIHWIFHKIFNPKSIERDEDEREREREREKTKTTKMKERLRKRRDPFQTKTLR